MLAVKPYVCRPVMWALCLSHYQQMYKVRIKLIVAHYKPVNLLNDEVWHSAKDRLYRNY